MLQNTFSVGKKDLHSNINSDLLQNILSVRKQDLHIHLLQENHECLTFISYFPNLIMMNCYLQNGKILFHGKILCNGLQGLDLI